MDALRRIRPRPTGNGTRTRTGNLSTGSAPSHVPVGNLDERNLRLRGADRRLATALDQLWSGVPLNWGQIEDDPEMTTLARLQQAGQECRAMPLCELPTDMKTALIKQLSARLPVPQAKKERVVPTSLAGFSENVQVLTQAEDNIDVGVNWLVTILRGAVGVAVLALVVWGMSSILKANSALAFSWIDVRRGTEPVSHVVRSLGRDAELCRVARQDNPTRPGFFVPVQSLRDAQANVGYNIPLLPDKITVPATYTFQLTLASVGPCQGNTLRPADPAGLVALRYDGQRVAVKSGATGKTPGIRPVIISLTMFALNGEPAYIDVGTGDWKEVTLSNAHGVYWRGSLYRDMASVQWNGDVSVLMLEHGNTVVTIVGSYSVGATEQVLTELARHIAW